MAKKVKQENLIHRCREVLEISKKCIEDGDLRTSLEKISIEAKVYTFKHRFKSALSIERKVRRKNIDGQRRLAELSSSEASGKPKEKIAGKSADLTQIKKAATRDKDYLPDLMTDIWACRYVVLFQSEIPAVVDAILKGLGKFNENTDSAVKLVEFVVYTNRPLNDPLSIAQETMKVLEKSPFLPKDDQNVDIRPPESRKSAYSSVHLVFRRDVKIELRVGQQTDESAGFEIQIRDIFEEGWGEVQHRLLYSEKDDLDALPSRNGVDESDWAIHLNALKTFVDGCGQHASIIGKAKEKHSRRNVPYLESQSTTSRQEDRDAILKVLKARGASNSAMDSVSDGYALLQLTEVDENPRIQTAATLQAAHHFSSALARLKKGLLKETVGRGKNLSVEFFLRVERANCNSLVAEFWYNLPVVMRSSNGGEDEKYVEIMRNAIVDYEWAVKNFPLDATSKLRLAKVLSRSAKDKSEFVRVFNLSQAVLDLAPDDPLTGDSHWIIISARAHFGSIRWKEYLLSKKNVTIQDKRKLLKDAKDYSVEAFAFWKKKHEGGANSEAKLIAYKALSNGLYFGAEIIKLTPSSRRKLKAELEDLIEQYEMGNLGDYRDAYKSRDNLIHAYRAIGNSAESSFLANENYRELRNIAEMRAEHVLGANQIREYLSKREIPSFDTALEVIGGID